MADPLQPPWFRAEFDAYGGVKRVQVVGVYDYLSQELGFIVSRWVQPSVTVLVDDKAHIYERASWADSEYFPPQSAFDFVVGTHDYAHSITLRLYNE